MQGQDLREPSRSAKVVGLCFDSGLDNLQRRKLDNAQNELTTGLELSKDQDSAEYALSVEAGAETGRCTAGSGGGCDPPVTEPGIVAAEKECVALLWM